MLTTGVCCLFRILVRVPVRETGGGGGANDEENTYRAHVLVHDLLKGGPYVAWRGATEGGEGGAPFTDALKGLRT